MGFGLQLPYLQSFDPMAGSQPMQGSTPPIVPPQQNGSPAGIDAAALQKPPLKTIAHVTAHGGAPLTPQSVYNQLYAPGGPDSAMQPPAAAGAGVPPIPSIQSDSSSPVDTTPQNPLPSKPSQAPQPKTANKGLQYLALGLSMAFPGSPIAHLASGFGQGLVEGTEKRNEEAENRWKDETAAQQYQQQLDAQQKRDDQAAAKNRADLWQSGFDENGNPLPFKMPPPPQGENGQPPTPQEWGSYYMGLAQQAAAGGHLTQAQGLVNMGSTYALSAERDATADLRGAQKQLTLANAQNARELWKRTMATLDKKDQTILQSAYIHARAEITSASIHASAAGAARRSPQDIDNEAMARALNQMQVQAYAEQVRTAMDTYYEQGKDYRAGDWPTDANGNPMPAPQPQLPSPPTNVYVSVPGQGVIQVQAPKAAGTSTTARVNGNVLTPDRVLHLAIQSDPSASVHELVNGLLMRFTPSEARQALLQAGYPPQEVNVQVTAALKARDNPGGGF